MHTQIELIIAAIITMAIIILLVIIVTTTLREAWLRRYKYPRIKVYILKEMKKSEGKFSVSQMNGLEKKIKSNLYPHLLLLIEDSLVTCKTKATNSNCCIYGLTTKGRSELERLKKLA